MSNTNCTESTEKPTAFELGLAALLRRYESIDKQTRGGGAWFDTETGRRYVRVVRVFGATRSVVCFVDGLNGDIRHADSWKKAGRVTGSIYPLSAEVSL